MTLTFDNRAPDPLSDPHYYSLAWNTFLKRLRRKYPTLKFARIVEITRNGRPHFHVLVDRYIPQRYVSWAFADCGGGKVADCRYVDPGRSARYITKYVTKSFDPSSNAPLFFFKSRMRSISTSRNLYYVVKNTRVNACAIRDFTDICSARFLAYTEFQIKNDNYYLFNDGRSPPLLWFPSAEIRSAFDDGMFPFPITKTHLQIFAFDLRELPNPDQIYIHFPPSISDTLRSDILAGSVPEGLLLSR